MSALYSSCTHFMAAVGMWKINARCLQTFHWGLLSVVYTHPPHPPPPTYTHTHTHTHTLVSFLEPNSRLVDVWLVPSLLSDGTAASHSSPLYRLFVKLGHGRGETSIVVFHPDMQSWCVCVCVFSAIYCFAFFIFYMLYLFPGLFFSVFGPLLCVVCSNARFSLSV